MRNPIKRINCLFKLSKDYNLYKRNLKVLHGFTDSVISERRALLRGRAPTSPADDTADSSLGSKKKMAFLDLLILSTVEGKPLSDRDIREEVDTFLFEGHDTTTSCISFALYLISNHPTVQEKLYKEQVAIFPQDVTRPVEQSDLQNMNYLELVIKETLRIYPSVPIIGRKIIADTNINGVHLPKDTSLMLLVYHLTRNPELFPDPDRFIPERFSAEEARKRSSFSSVPFSAGPRNCIGQKFAMLEIKSIISKILRNYKLETSGESLILVSEVILKSLNGVPIKLVPRTPPGATQ